MPVYQTETLIIGASIAGLACAACLQRQNAQFVVIEKESRAAAPWHAHYDRLHLHTNKSLSHLPFRKFEKYIPKYPSKRQVIDYLRNYQEHFNITPVFNTAALAVKEDGGYWITQTNNGSFRSRYVIMASGVYGKPRPIGFPGMQTFPGKIIHSSQYKTGKDFEGQKVLVVGFGNSACEIAMDLYEQGAVPWMSVRSAVNVIPRDILGIPVLQLSIWLNWLPPAVADVLVAPLISLLVGDLSPLGLQKLQYGPLRQMQKDQSVPVLDIGTMQHIREGHIGILPGIDFIKGNAIRFAGGNEQTFDAIVAAIGYHREYAQLTGIDRSRFEDLKLRAGHQQCFGKDGLYFCGYRVSPTGQIREIASDAKKIARDIGNRSKP